MENTLMSHTNSPNSHGYCFHIRQSSLGIASNKVARSASARLNRQMFVLVRIYSFFSITRHVATFPRIPRKRKILYDDLNCLQIVTYIYTCPQNIDSGIKVENSKCSSPKWSLMYSAISYIIQKLFIDTTIQQHSPLLSYQVFDRN